VDKYYDLVDVSHEIEDGMITYKGIPGPRITDFLSREDSQSHYAPGTQFHIGRIEMVANTGTYLDTPFHRYADGEDLAALDLKSVANLEGLVVRRRGAERAITVSDLTGLDVRGKAVLFDTGWDRHWRTEAYSGGSHPFVDREAAEKLATGGAALVGIDSYNIDDTAALDRPAHSILLEHRIPVVEHLCRLSELPDHNFRFFAVPVKIKSVGTFPVRAFGIVSKS
jgi:arylformamidase